MKTVVKTQADRLDMGKNMSTIHRQESKLENYKNRFEARRKQGNTPSEVETRMQL